MKIYFATSNENKVKEFRNFLGPLGIEVEQLNMEIPEIRNDDVEEVVKEKVKWASKKTGKTVVCEDSGIFIDAFRGFPGANSAYILKTIGIEGILKLMKGIPDRKAEFRSAIGLCEPGNEPISFLGTVEGKISGEIRGDKGFGYDPIFIYKGRTKTYAEDYELKKKTSHRVNSMKKFAEFLRENDE